MAEKVLFGLIGERLNYSLSPLIFNNYFKKLNLNYQYGLFPVDPESLPELLRKVKSSSVIGFNVTIPYKQEIIPYLDDLDQEAGRIGSVNVVHSIKGKLKGYNTDYSGFIQALQNHNCYGIKTAIVLGAGGASRSIIYSLYKLGINEIIFFCRSQSKLKRILDNLSFIRNLKGYIWQLEKLKEKTERANLIVNATPVGMFPFEDDSPFDIDFPVRENLIAFDLIYNPRETKFLREARRRGIMVENGLRMLIYQALESYKIWRNQDIDEEFFIKISEEVLHASLLKRR